MAEKQLKPSGINWREQIHTCRTELEKVRHQLVEAETKLAERLAAIHAFEFKFRARIEPLLDRLEKIEAEIKAFLKKLLYERPEEMEAEEFWAFDESDSAASGDYRYRDASTAEAQPKELSQDEKNEIKQLYRQLARRFHPDMAVDEEDRAHRTQLMMAINAAYAAGDLDKLQELALEPDTAKYMDGSQTDKQIAEALQRELEGCRRRLEEIKRELKELENHHSAHLMKQAEQAEAEGRDFLAEVEKKVRYKIMQKTIERDMLKSEEEKVSEAILKGVAFDDPVADLNQWYEAQTGDEEWREHNKVDWWDDDILDDMD